MRKGVLKRLSVLVLMVFVLGIAVGCGGGAQNAGDEDKGGEI